MIVLVASSGWAGSWEHKLIEGYEYWYLNAATTAKFRYNWDKGQWWHHSNFGSTDWYTISATSQSDTFIGDGGWYTLGNGFTYSYYEGYDDGYFKEGAVDRFRYRYASGQWLHSGDSLSWQLLGSSGLGGKFVGSGYLCDLGNGFTYKYYAPYHDGFFKEGDSYRFRYGYTSGQWYHSGDTLSWLYLGNSGLSGKFVGSGYLCDLGNGFTYKYCASYHDGYFKEGDSYRFRYGYTSGQWYHSGNTLAWRLLGSTGRCAAFVGSGHLCDLGNGFTYWYYARYHDGYFKEGAADRFRYRYTSGQWYHSGDTLSWQLLGNTGLSAAFLGSGYLCDLGNGFTYWYYARYHDGYFRVGDSYRFRYRYTTGQWCHSGVTLSWKALGDSGLTAAFMGDGSPHDLGTWWGNLWKFTYNATEGRGEFARYITDTWYNRFAYDYDDQQWYHNGALAGWGALGSAGNSAQFIADSAWNQIVGGTQPWYYQYQAEHDVGFWARDAGGTVRRFWYLYAGSGLGAAGQWFHNDSVSGYNVIGAPVSLSTVAFMGDGGRHADNPDANTWWYSYDYTNDKALWDRSVAGDGSQLRFSYLYGTGQWGHIAGVAGSYGEAILGATSNLTTMRFIGRSEAQQIVSGSQPWWWYVYDYSLDGGGWSQVNPSGLEDMRFGYGYATGTWLHKEAGSSTFAILGAATGSMLGSANGGFVSFAGDGSWGQVNGSPLWYYQYWYTGNQGRWSRTAGFTDWRFAYEYTPKQWWHVDSIGGSNTIGAPVSLGTLGFIGDGGWHADNPDANTWWYSYDYTNDKALWDRSVAGDGSQLRFSYAYATGQWGHIAGVAGSYGEANLGAPINLWTLRFIGDGNVHQVGSSPDWFYKYAYNTAGAYTADSGYWSRNSGTGFDGNTRFVFDYAGGQWFHHGVDGWRDVGNAGYSPAFIGDGFTHDLGDWYGNNWRFTYDSTNDMGRFSTGSDTAWRLAYHYTDKSWHFWERGDRWVQLSDVYHSADFIGDGTQHVLVHIPWCQFQLTTADRFDIFSISSDPRYLAYNFAGPYWMDGANGYGLAEITGGSSPYWWGDSNNFLVDAIWLDAPSSGYRMAVYLFRWEVAYFDASKQGLWRFIAETTQWWQWDGSEWVPADPEYGGPGLHRP